MPNTVASIAINPREAVAPFTSSIDIRVSPGAAPGTYAFKLRIHDTATNALLGLESLALIVLRRGLPKTLAKHYQKLKTMYRTYGAQAAVWYILTHVFKDGATFTQIKNAYEIIVGETVSNGTIGNILGRMRRKRIIIEKHPGVYTSNVKDFNVLLSRIDSSRVRIQANRVRKSKRVPQKMHGENARVDFSRLPKTVRRVWEKAQEIAREHSTLAALYFLIYTLLGVRQTGHLLYWFNAWFIYCEQKTGFCHHFYSELLNEMLRKLGLRQGIQHNYFNKQEHMEAQRIAQEFIKRYYVSHPNARRLHYILKELGYIEYDNEVYTLKIFHYPDNTIGLEIYDDKGEELLHSDSIRRDLTPSRVEIKPAFPFEHVDEQNENTYFIRPAGLY
ncbi:hypothetical protein Pdsh_03125 [Pyrodictium delaneyi]|uniref:Uncharacterized protein n=1 Tax=Pyrodictium delaneyi TaxID=1273541 RepID=A0A211YNY9_9CREN|nr:hypothetical protein Pdsh_03125 [Pyrodictium delaneyi]